MPRYGFKYGSSLLMPKYGLEFGYREVLQLYNDVSELSQINNSYTRNEGLYKSLMILIEMTTLGLIDLEY